jgi:alpha-galactosidase
MMANPLGWFEVSSLPMKYTDSVAPLVKKWKQERNRLYSGFLLPIGQNPDGVAWTGFASVAKDGGGYLLLFRELNEDPTWAMPLSIFPGAVNHLTVLGGEGSADLANGQITVRIPLKLGFLWLRVDGTPPTAPSSNGGSSQR